MTAGSKLLFVVFLFGLAALVSASDPQNATFNQNVNVTPYEGSSSASAVTAVGGNLTYLDVSSDQQTGRWQAFFGLAAGNIVLRDSNSDTFYTWTVAAPSGEVIAVQDYSFDFSSVAAENTAGNLDTAWSFASGSDQVADTFAASANAEVEIAGTTIGAGSALSTEASDGNFNTTVVNDGSSAAKDDFAFVCPIVDNTAGYNGTDFDFELLVPTTDGGSDNYYLFIELD
jgi:hypothetical protein